MPPPTPPRTPAEQPAPAERPAPWERPALWDDSAPRHDWSATPLAPRYDVAVVGAGITGLATAIELAEHGCSVVVLESRQVGAGASGRTTAKVSLLQGTRLSELDSRHDGALVEQYVAGNRAGQAWVLSRARELGVDVQQRAAVTFAADDDQLEAVEREQEACERLGLPVRWRQGGDEPFDVVGAVVLDGQLQLDPRLLLEALATHAASLGVALRTGARVTDIHDDDAVVSTAGTVHAGHVVLATGSPVSDRGAFFARLEAHRSYLTAFEPAGPVPQDMYLSAGEPVRSVRSVPGPDGDVLLVGGNNHVVGRTDSEAMQAQDLVDWTERHFPGAVARYRWSAQDFHTFDGLPHVGPLTPRSHRVLVATGFAKWGMTNGVAAAAILAALVTDEDAPAWSDAFRSWSSHELAGTTAALRANAQVAATLVRDQLAITGAAEGEAPPIEGSGVVAREGVSPVATSTVEGETCTVSGACTHLGGIVRWNDLERSWDCPLHGSRFAPDGSVLEGPASSPLEPVESS